MFLQPPPPPGEISQLSPLSSHTWLWWNLLPSTPGAHGPPLLVPSQDRVLQLLLCSAAGQAEQFGLLIASHSLPYRHWSLLQALVFLKLPVQAG